MTPRLTILSGRPCWNSLVSAFALAGLTLLSACSVGGNESVSEANDQLRRERIALESTIATLTGEKEELRVKLAESERARGTNVPADVLDAVPRCTGVSIGSFSGFDPADPDKPATGVTIYVQPHDGRGRFVPMVGTLRATAQVLPRDPQVSALAGQARTELSPAKLRDSFRDSVLGTAYAVELRFESPVADRTLKLLIRVEFIDALTGQTHQADVVR